MLQPCFVGSSNFEYVGVKSLSDFIEPNPDGSYSASITAPSEGWIGFMIEVEYRRDNDPYHYMEVTSEVNIVPDRYPFAPCSRGNGC